MGEFPFDPAIYVFHLSVAIGRLRDAQLERELRPVGINLAKYRALTVILRFDACTMTELAEYSAVDRTTLTRTIDQLVKDALVRRGAKPQDRRQVVLTLTTAGRRVAAAARDTISRHNRRVLEGVPDEQVRGMVRTQKMIAANLVGDRAMLERLLTLQPPADAEPRPPSTR
ncbi:MAG TPA: MarR family transcriptional regulator [Caulobacteraceae bacterium]